ncbi:hypothetical protein, partial [Alkaliflexus imshenetskii]|uniref:hypothetical protein n=1 Tax=Alkaliflexus imshenetskii TaxID=286730 RepID=UPI0015882844
MKAKNEDDTYDLQATLSRVSGIQFKRTRLLLQSGFIPFYFYYWRKQLGNTAQEAPERFVPLVIDSAPTQKTKHNKHVAIATNKTDGLSISQAPVELVFPNGTKMVIRENIDLRL